jgi:hypothetical protein
MAIPTTAIHILRLLLQADQNLSGLQRDIRSNALAWSAAASAASIPQATLRQQILDAAASYNTRLGWIATAQANVPVWSALSSMWVILGGVAGDFAASVNPMQAVATQLLVADLSSYAAIITACASITTAINAPVSLWPE